MIYGPKLDRVLLLGMARQSRLVLGHSGGFLFVNGLHERISIIDLNILLICRIFGFEKCLEMLGVRELR